MNIQCEQEIVERIFHECVTQNGSFWPITDTLAQVSKHWKAHAENPYIKTHLILDEEKILRQRIRLSNLTL